MCLQVQLSDPEAAAGRLGAVAKTMGEVRLGKCPVTLAVLLLGRRLNDFLCGFLGKTAFLSSDNVKGDGKAVKKKKELLCRFRVSGPKLLKLLRNAIGNLLHTANGARECLCGFVWFVCVL